MPPGRDDVNQIESVSASNVGSFDNFYTNAVGDDSVFLG
jgi:hypothetical protein